MKAVKTYERQAHPGWAVKFSDGTWLGGAHGWFRTDDPFYADVYASEKDAKESLDYVKNDVEEGDYFKLDAEVVPAWESLCESLRFEVSQLKKANVITPEDLSEAVMRLEDVISGLQGRRFF